MTKIDLQYDLANDTPADAVPVEANFNRIEQHINQELIERDGTVAMREQLRLVNSTPLNEFDATSKGYVDAGLAPHARTGAFVQPTVGQSLTFSVAVKLTFSAVTEYNGDWWTSSPSGDLVVPAGGDGLYYAYSAIVSTHESIVSTQIRVNGSAVTVDNTLGLSVDGGHLLLAAGNTVTFWATANTSPAGSLISSSKIKLVRVSL